MSFRELVPGAFAISDILTKCRPNAATESRVTCHPCLDLCAELDGRIAATPFIFHGPSDVSSSISYLCLAFFLIAVSLQGQIPTAATFQAQAQSAVSGGKVFSGVTIAANAEWTAGSLHQTGTAPVDTGLAP
jgi:hypothetical protein